MELREQSPGKPEPGWLQTSSVILLPLHVKRLYDLM